jgi:hypothetical protein
VIIGQLSCVGKNRVARSSNGIVDQRLFRAGAA